ncbi:unnamed protein product [Candidula unifasciata]|uniref:Uncharacterized protein n=1 Tax=Candidula unifasciata TaxID=100452 RepID=A0A8S3ZDG0_9EUPU|nr:unnamed protein product [Candidula unifasciata]
MSPSVDKSGDLRGFKSLATLIVPSLLFALLMFQIYSCRSRLKLRNSYLLESLPPGSDWVWDSLSAGHSSRFEDVSSQTPDSGKSKPEINASYDQTHNYHRSVLLPGIPSLTVHYVWCTEGYFELGHYLSILSVIKQLQPDKIVIHYRSQPRADPQGYWRWLEDLQRNVAMLSMRPLSNYRICRHDLSAGVTYDHYDFPDPYGVFLLGDIAISNLTRSDVTDLIKKSFSQRASASYLKTVPPATEEELLKSQVFLVSDTEPYHTSQSPGRVVITCPAVSTVNSLKLYVNVSCIGINSYLSSEELLIRDSRFHRFARSVMYGSPNVINAPMFSSVQIPNSIHIILKDGVTQITPLLYLSIKSAYFKGKVDDVFVHAATPPAGTLWDRLRTRHELNVKHIPMPSSEELNTKHTAMAYALFTLLQHGGIAHFGDVVFLKPIPLSLRHAGAIATPHYSEFRLRHQSTNTAVLAGSKGSVFVESFLARLRQEDLKSPDVRADDIATHTREIHPESVLLDSQLTSHQKCDKVRCQVVGGHGHPKQTYTTRLIWDGEQPGTLDQLLLIEGPIKTEIKEIIEISHFIHLNAVP